MFSWDDVIGQAEIKRHLTEWVDAGHLPHALLLCGEPGCGKMAIALALARYLCCTNRGDGRTCGTCRPCLQWDKLQHPDVHFLFPIIANKSKKKETCADYLPQWNRMLTESTYFTFARWNANMGAETNGQATIYTRESDEIARRLSLKSLEGGYKVTIVWLPEKMQEAGANKMLKLLEEPPAYTVFILVSEDPGHILPTILSRCQRVQVPRISTAAIQQALEERWGVAPGDSRAIARLAEGSFTAAIDAIQANQDNELCLEHFMALMRLAYQRKVRELKSWSEELAAMSRERQKAFLDYCQHMVRESFIYNMKQSGLNYMSRGEEAFASRFAPFVNERNVLAIEDELTEAQNHIEQNVNAKMVFFDFALRMIMLLKQ